MEVIVILMKLFLSTEMGIIFKKIFQADIYKVIILSK